LSFAENHVTFFYSTFNGDCWFCLMAAVHIWREGEGIHWHFCRHVDRILSDVLAK